MWVLAVVLRSHNLLCVTAAILAGLVPGAWRLEFRPRQVISDLEARGGTVEWIETPEGRRLRMVRWSGGDEGLDLLENVPELRWLDLSRTKITDEGLIKVGKLTNLEGLKLSQCRITDKGLAHCAGWCRSRACRCWAPRSLWQVSIIWQGCNGFTRST